MGAQATICCPCIHQSERLSLSHWAKVEKYRIYPCTCCIAELSIPRIVHLQHFIILRINRDTDSQSGTRSGRHISENTIHAPKSFTTGGVTGMIEAARARCAQYRVYRKTLSELGELSNRELADLGLNRSMLKRIALEAAYGEVK